MGSITHLSIHLQASSKTEFEEGLRVPPLLFPLYWRGDFLRSPHQIAVRHFLSEIWLGATKPNVCKYFLRGSSARSEWFFLAGTAARQNRASSALPRTRSRNIPVRPVARGVILITMAISI